VSNLIVSQEAELNTIELLIGSMLQVGYMRLLGSAITVDPATTLANCLAAEAAFPGYAPALLSSWSSPAIDGTGAAASTSSSGIFNNTGGVAYPTYGLFLCDSSPSKLWAVEAFSSPVNVPPGLGFNNIVTYSVLSRY
jgi:hypothetical protein